MTYHPLSPVWEAQMASPVASSGGPGGGHPSPSAVESFAFVFCFIFVTLRCPRFMNHSASTRLQRRGFFLLSGYRKLHIHAHICTHITHICIQLHYRCMKFYFYILKRMYIFKIKGLHWHHSFKTSITVFSYTLCHLYFPSLLQRWELAFPASSTKYLLIHFILQHTRHLMIATSLPRSTISLTKIHNIFLIVLKIYPTKGRWGALFKRSLNYFSGSYLL